MPRPTPRPFLLSDLMVLIAAVAGGIAVQRWVETPAPPFRISVGPTEAQAAIWFTYAWSEAPTYQVVPWVAALVLLRWRRPRPTIRRVLRQPGATASLAAVVALLAGYSVHEVGQALQLADPNGGMTFTFREEAWQAALAWPGPAVAGVWIAQAGRGRWRAERSWIDRLGRLAGIYWLLGAILAESFRPLLDRPASFIYL